MKVRRCGTTWGAENFWRRWIWCFLVHVELLSIKMKVINYINIIKLTLHIFANPCQDYFLFLAGSSSILLPHKDLSRLYTASASWVCLYINQTHVAFKSIYTTRCRPASMCGLEIYLCLNRILYLFRKQLVSDKMPCSILMHYWDKIIKLFRARSCDINRWRYCTH